ncbi:hypothetical protein AB205_0028390 [Aquarana catesbeiana]|uniref:Uncharacterized protein n=1 Tax=Aquarana catesbeiana TaxID=8400 RepID=A0A2G9R3P1_AQUCT|nr:hypothetical protein AB205_0028390 [Aquarana catesbeiana]
MMELVTLFYMALQSRETIEGFIQQVQYQILPISNTQAKRRQSFMQNQ